MRNKTIGDLAKKIKVKGKCKLCDKPKYLQSRFCWKHYLEDIRNKKAEKALKKKTKHETTKVYQKEVCDKLIRQNDRLYQELGRKLYTNCWWGHEYSCLHHFIRKSQSLNTRYDIENGIPICQACHCSIHQAQNSIMEAGFAMSKGEKWLSIMSKKKETLVINKLEFLKEKNIALKKALGENI